ncbi:unnamed protein product, partial [Ixodes hexagonus]
ALLFGYLCEVCSCRTVLLSSTLITAVGISLCYFAPSLPFITILFGIVHGGTLGGIFVAVNTISTQHFKRWQATAVNLAIASQGLNVFFMQQLTAYFIFEYGTLETFLLVGAATLNAFPAALALKSPPWAAASKSQKSMPLELRVVEPKTPQGNGEQSQESTDNTAENKNSPPVSGTSAIAPDKNSIGLREDATSSRNRSHYLSKLFKFHDLKKSLKVLLSLKFHVDAFSFAIQMYVLTTFIVVHADFARDKNIELGSGIYMMHSYTIGDIIFRVVGGFLVDRRLVALETVIMFSFVGAAVACEGLVWSSSMVQLLLISLFLGSSEGLIVSLPAIVLLNDFQGRPLPMVFGALRFIAGLLLMTRPPLLGYFRDNGGKYDGLFHTLAIVNGLVGVVWAIRRMHLKNRHSIKSNMLP